MQLKSHSVIFFLTFALISCDGSSEKVYRKEPVQLYLSDDLKRSKNIFGIKGEDIGIYSGPGETFEKVVNQKASDIFNKTMYASVDYSVKVREIEKKEGWSKIEVVEPSYLTASHKGWIESKFIEKGGKPKNAKDAVNKRKIIAFNNVSALKKNLSGNGIGNLREWRYDGLSWMASTDYFSFGTESQRGLKNNLAYYLDSDNRLSVRSLDLVVNIYNVSEKSEAIMLFVKIAKRTFTTLKMRSPEGLIDAMKNERVFESTNGESKISLSVIKSRIDTWKLTIETK